MGSRCPLSKTTEPGPGGCDSSAIGVAKPQEVFSSIWISLVPFARPIDKQSGGPQISSGKWPNQRLLVAGYILVTILLLYRFFGNSGPP